MQNKLFFTAFFLVVSCRSTDLARSAYYEQINVYRIQQEEELRASQGPLQDKPWATLDYYAPDERYKVMAEYRPETNKELRTIRTYSNMEKEYINIAILHFRIGKEKFQLTAMKGLLSMRIPQYRDKLFIMFKDLTNGESTYGGGRYLYINESKVKDGMVELDFNKAFNPYCAYSDGYNCPIPPPENHLAANIEAGEKSFPQN